MAKTGTVLLGVTGLCALLSFMVLLILQQQQVFSTRTGVPSWSMVLADSAMFTLLNQLLFTVYIVLRMYITVAYVRDDRHWVDVLLVSVTGLQFVLYMCVFVISVEQFETAHLLIALFLIITINVREWIAWGVRYKHLGGKKYYVLQVINFFLLLFLLAFSITYVASTLNKYQEYTTAIATLEYLVLQMSLALPMFDMMLIEEKHVVYAERGEEEEAESLKVKEG